MPLGSGVLSRDPQRAAARFELAGGIEAYLGTAARFVGDDGAVCMLMDGDQDDRCRRAVDDAGLALRRVTAFVPRKGRAVRYLGYVAGRTSAGLVERSLDIRDEHGNLTAPMLAIRRTLELP
jgi:tRNA1(Val) A37 N6-methylase TrmN6